MDPIFSPIRNVSHLVLKFCNSNACSLIDNQWFFKMTGISAFKSSLPKTNEAQHPRSAVYDHKCIVLFYKSKF